MSLVRPGPIRRALTTAVVLVVSACTGDGPQVPTVSAPTNGITFAATVASLVNTIPTVKITDAKGRAIKNVLVRWQIRAGGGRVVNDTVRTLENGEGTSGGWTLGPVAGSQILQANVEGLAAVTFIADAAAGPATTVVRVSPDPQRATVNTAVATPPAVRVEDSFGNPVPGVTVTFTAAAGGGVIAGAQQTSNTAGVASAVSWTLGTISGQQFARATIPNATQAAFSATALAGAPVDLVKAGGDSQQGVNGAPISAPPGVRVIDEFGNAVGDVPITFTPGANSGTVTAGIVSTDPANGTAFVGNWILGNGAQQTLVATSTLLPGKSVTFTASVVESLFDIDVRFIGDGGTQRQRDAFIKAAAKWRRVIVGDVHTVRINDVAGDCDTWIPAINESINDLVVFARIRPIDGVGKILAQAGPCVFSTVSNLTVYGLMEFDQDDLPGMIANGTLDDVVLHEMGHVLGIGTLWSFRRNLLTGRGGGDPFFSGVGARTEFSVIGGATYAGPPVPVENTGGAGTRDSHWRASVFGRELMQGFARAGGMPLSRVTAASLADLGYRVILGSADPFALTAALRTDFEILVPLVDDIADIPLRGVAPDGTKTLVRAATVKR